MIDTEKETTCKACGRPLVQTGKGPRKREFCNDACKQVVYRLRKERQEREKAEAAMRARWGDFLLVTQQVLEDVMHLHSMELAQRVTQAIKNELQGRLNVEERFRMDTQARHFKSWLRKRARYYAESDFGKRFLDSPDMPPLASRAMYEARMRSAGYSAEDIETFREAWKAMLIDQS